MITLDATAMDPTFPKGGQAPNYFVTLSIPMAGVCVSHKFES